MAPISALLATWFTPSSLFIVVNLVIGTIAVTSRFTSPKRQTHHDSELGPQLVRSPSLLERVRSFRLTHYTYNCEPTTAALSETESTHPQLVRTPSFLERVRSFKLGHYTYNYEPTLSEPAEFTQPQLVRTPSLLERVRSFNFGLHKHETDEHVQAQVQAHQPEPEDPTEPHLTRAPSLLQRLHSMSFSRIYRSDSVHQDEHPEPESYGPGGGSGVKEVTEMMRKSASERGRVVKCEWEEDEETVEKRRPESARFEATSSLREDDEEVDAKADDFINKFKKQLRLQRIDSILRNREMLTGN